jgi:hypothetical protein
VDYTCAWERTFGLGLGRLPNWVQRRLTVSWPRRPSGTIDIAEILELSQRVERNARAQNKLETAKIGRARVTRIAA